MNKNEKAIAERVAKSVVAGSDGRYLRVVTDGLAKNWASNGVHSMSSNLNTAINMGEVPDEAKSSLQAVLKDLRKLEKDAQRAESALGRALHKYRL